MIRTLALLALLTASAPIIAAAEPAKGHAAIHTATPSKADAALDATVPWWEKVTVSLAGDGKSNSCRYETSLDPAASKNCDVEGDAKSLADSDGKSSAKDQLTRLTFERRFNPGSMAPQDAALETGDTLLGRQVLSLAIDAAGKVKGCRVVSKSGDMTPSYGCEDAQAEHFTASAARPGTGEGHEGFMTILVYGHEEHVV